MKIRYARKFIVMPVVFGLLYLLMGCSSLFFSGQKLLAFFVPIGILHLLEAYIRYRKGYLRLDPDGIKINGILGRSLPQSQILEVLFFAGDYKIRSAKKELVIDKNLIDKKELPAFETYFEKLRQDLSARSPSANSAGN